MEEMFLLKYDYDMVTPGVLNENKLFVCMCMSGMCVCCVLFVCIWILSLYDRVCVEDAFFFLSAHQEHDLNSFECSPKIAHNNLKLRQQSNQVHPN